MINKTEDVAFDSHINDVAFGEATASKLLELNRKLGEEIGSKAVAAMGPTTIMIPLKGVSAIDQAGKAFDDPAARQALYDGVRATQGGVELVELDSHINDAIFAEAAARRLLPLFGR